MPTSFICRQCIARLTKSSTSQFKPKRFQLHTQAASTSAPPPTWPSPEGQRQEYPMRYDLPDSHGVQLPPSEPFPPLQEPQFEPAIEQKPSWDGRITKFVPRPRKETKAIAREPPARGSQELKDKILRALGDYNVVRDDLMRIYSLSREGARHTVGQLERLLWGRNSSVEAGSRLDQFHFWKKHFKELLNITDGWRLAPEYDDGSARTDAWTYLEKQDVETVKDIWLRLERDRRQMLWPQMIILAFRSNPSTLLSLVQASFESSWCPSYIIEDIVYLLSRTLDDTQAGRSKHRAFSHLVFFLLKNSPPRYIVLEQTAVRKTLYSVSRSKAIELYQELQRIEHPLHPNTLLHFASRFASSSRYKVQAADIIHHLSTIPGFDINSPAAASVCTSLLTINEGEKLPDDHAAPDELFRMLLEAGFRPNILSLSALMRNFCVRGRVEVAWSIFDLLIERGIEPDVHVYSMLLNGAKRVLDMESIRHLVRMIETHDVWSVHLLNDLLETIYQFNESQISGGRRQRKRHAANAWRLMVQVYAKFLKLAPLQKFTLFPLENLLPKNVENFSPHLTELNKLAVFLKRRPDARLIEPDSVTLAVMLSAHFRSIQTPRPLKAYYNHLVELLRRGDREMVKLVKEQGTRVYNILLRDLLQFKSTLQDGVSLVQTLHDNAKREMERFGRNSLHPPPSVETYTILMAGLRSHRNTRGVVTTLNLMIKEGLTPNIVTWNVVLGALLRDGHLTRAVKVLRHIQQIGLEANKRTAQEIARLSLRKRKRFAELMEAMAKRPVDYSNQRLFAKSLLRIWDKREERAARPLPRIHQRFREARKLDARRAALTETAEDTVDREVREDVR